MEIVKDLLYVLITVALPIVVYFLCKFLRSKWNEIQTNIEDKETAEILGQVVDMVIDCVQYTNQVFVDELKKKGEFTKEASLEAFKMSKERALAMLSEESKAILIKIYGNVDIYLDTIIEANVKQLKD